MFRFRMAGSQLKKEYRWLMPPGDSTTISNTDELLIAAVLLGDKDGYETIVNCIGKAEEEAYYKQKHASNGLMSRDELGDMHSQETLVTRKLSRFLNEAEKLGSKDWLLNQIKIVDPEIHGKLIESKKLSNVNKSNSQVTHLPLDSDNRSTLIMETPTAPFRLEIYDSEPVLVNVKTGKRFSFSYRAATMYNRGSGWKTESDWSGTVGQLFEALIPLLSIIWNSLQPGDDHFESRPAADEHGHGSTEHYNEYQLSQYKVIMPSGVEATFKFNNASLISDGWSECTKDGVEIDCPDEIVTARSKIPFIKLSSSSNG